MNCRKIRKLLLTDYLDGQASKNTVDLVTKHLSGCESCSRYYSVIKKTTVEPFSGIKREFPSEKVWLKIKELIRQKEQAELQPETISFYDKLRGLLAYPKLVPVAGSFAVILILVFSFLGRSTLRKQELAGLRRERISQMEYLGDLFLDSGYLSEIENGDYGQAIEEVFLL